MNKRGRMLFLLFLECGLVEGEYKYKKKLDSILAQFPKESHPEGVVIEDEFERDIENLYRALHEKKRFEFSRVLGRNFSLETNLGVIDRVILALNGILPDKLSYMKKEVSDEVTVSDISRLSGIRRQTLMANNNNGKLYSRYSVCKKGRFYVLEPESASKFMSDLNNSIFLNELIDGLNEYYGIGKHTLELKLKNVASFQFGSQARAIKLNVVNDVANDVLRDFRIIKTHYGVWDAAVKAGFRSGNTMRNFANKGLIKSRKVKIVPNDIADKHFICDFDVERFLDTNIPITYQNVSKILYSEGLIYGRNIGYLVSRELGLEVTGRGIPFREVDKIIDYLNSNGRFSPVYKSFCQNRGLSPESSQAKLAWDEMVV